ncbi:hypothetical protein [Pseudomonas zeae]|uniref:hypothetical protein n=1 Tax=Pseudomonas zeae TaxID=2745510 RepID=UPI0039E0A928
MFITNKQTEVRGFQPMLEPGHQGWHVVQQHMMSPWFHTTIARRLDDLEIDDVVFVDSLPALTSLLELTELGVKVKSVRLVSPKWLNGTDDWHMDGLTEIALSPDGTSLRYRLHDGRHFYFPEKRPDVSAKYDAVFSAVEETGS